MFNAKTQNEFLTQDEVNQFLDAIQNTNAWQKSGVEFWDERIISFHNVKDKLGGDLNILFSSVINRIKDFINKEYEPDKEIVPDAISICRWFPGMEQPPHADDMTNTDTKGYEHNLFGSIIYLNTNYTGGKTYYPDYGIEITPEVGKLAVHPGDVNHMHGVSKIEENIRYTIACFWKYKVEQQS